MPEGRGGAISGWEAAIERADTPPADIVPGTLGRARSRSRLRVGYAGLRGRAQPRGDRGGRPRAAASSGCRSTPPALRWPRGGAAVATSALARRQAARRPRAGSRALAALLAARRPGDLVLVVSSRGRCAGGCSRSGPPVSSGGSNLRSDSTRTDGLVSATDIAPTVLEQLGLAVPDDVAGEPIEASGNRSADELTELRDRLAEVGPRRWTVVLGGLAGAALLRRRCRRGSVRLAAGALGAGGAFLAALWLPSVLLVTGALAPSRLGELVLIAVAAPAAGAATDRLLPWPWAIVLRRRRHVLSHI